MNKGKKEILMTKAKWVEVGGGGGGGRGKGNKKKVC